METCNPIKNALDKIMLAKADGAAIIATKVNFDDIRQKGFNFSFIFLGLGNREKVTRAITRMADTGEIQIPDETVFKAMAEAWEEYNQKIDMQAVFLVGVKADTVTMMARGNRKVIKGMVQMASEAIKGNPEVLSFLGEGNEN